MTEKHLPLLPEDADERRMWDDSKEALGLTSLQRVGMTLHAASQMAPQGGSYREVMAIAYNEVTKADAILRAVNGLPEAIAALEAMLDEYDRNVCEHEITTRGGHIWTICEGCGRKWADDEGGFVPHSDPPHVVAARAALTKLKG